MALARLQPLVLKPRQASSSQQRWIAALFMVAVFSALVWITDGNVTLLGSGIACRMALTIPLVTLDRSPSGLPMAIATSPT